MQRTVLKRLSRLCCSQLLSPTPLASLFTSANHSQVEDPIQLLSRLKYNYTPDQCEAILRSGTININMQQKMSDREYFSKQVAHCPIHDFEVFTLGSNKPCEDFWNFGVNQVDGSMSSVLFSVVDGHSGKQCGEFVNRASLEWVASGLLDRDKLQAVYKNMREIDGYHIMRRFFPNFFQPLPKVLYDELHNRLLLYIEEMLNLQEDDTLKVHERMRKSLVRLDNDISEVTIKGINTRNKEFSRLGTSGAVGIVGRIYWSHGEPDIHLANTGDCRAAIFSRSTDGTLSGKFLTTMHSAENKGEVQRLLDSHPSTERDTVLRENRLLGELAPLRAFGDLRYKWNRENLAKLVRLFNPAAVDVDSDDSNILCPNNYLSPPYLTAAPDVVRHQIGDNDEFLLLGTDGLWDFLTLEDVAEILTRHSAQQPRRRSELLVHTLAKYALGVVDEQQRTSYPRLSTTLSLPYPLSRNIRDDMTIMLMSLK